MFWCACAAAIRYWEEVLLEGWWVEDPVRGWWCGATWLCLLELTTPASMGLGLRPYATDFFAWLDGRLPWSPPSKESLP